MAVEEIIPNEIKKEIYNDGFQSTLTETGKAVSLFPRVIKNAFSKVEMWCLNKEFIVEEFKIELEKKLENKKSENIVDANPRIFIPAAQSISYSWDEKEIKELYLNLIASDMDGNTKGSVHPSFTEVIKQMDTIDVKLFTTIYESVILPVYELTRKSETGGVMNVLEYLLSDDYYSLAPENMIIKSLNNLERLKLINISFEKFYKNEQSYYKLENGESIQKYKNEYKENLEINKGIIEQTEFGKDFYSVCCK